MVEILLTTRAEKNMNIEKKNGVTYLTFNLLKKAGVRHGFSTRLGGVSEGCFSSLNLGFGRGDLDENVRENFKRVTGALGIDYERLCFSKQTHTNNVIIVNEEDAGNQSSDAGDPEEVFQRSREDDRGDAEAPEW